MCITLSPTRIVTLHHSYMNQTKIEELNDQDRLKLINNLTIYFYNSNHDPDYYSEHYYSSKEHQLLSVPEQHHQQMIDSMEKWMLDMEKEDLINKAKNNTTFKCQK